MLDGNVKAVIELKGTNTQDLDRVAFQAFCSTAFPRRRLRRWKERDGMV